MLDIRSTHLGQAGQRCAGGTILIIHLVKLVLLSLDLKDELSQALLLETGPFAKSTLIDEIQLLDTFTQMRLRLDQYGIMKIFTRCDIIVTYQSY